MYLQYPCVYDVYTSTYVSGTVVLDVDALEPHDHENLLNEAVEGGVEPAPPDVMVYPTPRGPGDRWIDRHAGNDQAPPDPVFVVRHYFVSDLGGVNQHLRPRGRAASSSDSMSNHSHHPVLSKKKVMFGQQSIRSGCDVRCRNVSRPSKRREDSHRLKHKWSGTHAVSGVARFISAQLLLVGG